MSHGGIQASFLAACTVAHANMPRTGRTAFTFPLERFKRQFWQLYCVDSFQLPQVTLLFTWLFEMLAIIENKGERIPMFALHYHHPRARDVSINESTNIGSPPSVPSRVSLDVRDLPKHELIDNYKRRRLEKTPSLLEHAETRGFPDKPRRTRRHGTLVTKRWPGTSRDCGEEVVTRSKLVREVTESRPFHG